MSLGLLPVLAVTLAQAWVDGVPLWTVLALSLITLPLPLLHWAHGPLGYALTTKLLLVTGFATVLFLETMHGLTAGAALLSNSLLLLATLLFGKRAFRWWLGICLATLALGYYLHSRGLGPPEAWKMVDPSRPLVWVRQALVLTFLGAAVRELSLDSRALEYERLLNEVGGVLASSLRVEQTLGEVSRRVVRDFADLCMIELRNGGPRQLHVTAGAPERAWLAEALRDQPSPHDPRLDCEVWRSHQPELAKVTHDYLVSHSRGPEHLALLEALQARSIISAPLISRGHMFGALLAISSTRVYDGQDLQLLTQIAERAAMAIENAQLHEALRDANDETQAKYLELREAQAKIRTLTGLLPVCAWCGKIRVDRENTWKRFDQYVRDNTSADVSHTICPGCAKRAGFV
jgi:hypothetical protein